MYVPWIRSTLAYKLKNNNENSEKALFKHKNRNVLLKYFFSKNMVCLFILVRNKHIRSKNANRFPIFQNI